MSDLTAKLPEVAPFRNIVTVLGECVKDALFIFSDAGLFVQVRFVGDSCTVLHMSLCSQAMDEANISLVQFVMSPQDFEEYHCDHAVRLGIRIATLLNMLRFGGPRDDLTLSYSDGGDELILEMHREGREAKLKLFLLTLSWDMMEIPRVDYPCRATLSSEDMKEIITRMVQSGDTTRIAWEHGPPHSITFSSRGHEAEGAITLQEEGIVCRPHFLAENVQTKMLGWLKMAPRLANAVEVLMTKEAPVEFRLDTSVGGNLKFFLAPKISDEELCP